MPAPILSIVVRGPFAVVSRERGDLTPKERKARGLLGQLALAPDLRRERDWLKEHLWSDRGPGQASGSLRQALTQVRARWGEHGRALLGANKPWVGLDPELVEIDDGGDGALLEGIGVYDEGFRGWLAAQRAADGRPGAPPTPTPAPASAAPGGDPERLLIRCPPPRDASSASLLGEIIAHQVAEGVAEQVRARRVVRAEGDGPADLDVVCDVVETGSESLAFLRVVHPPTGEILYEARHRGDGPAAMLIANDGMKRTAHEAIEATIGRLPGTVGLERPVLKATALGRLALLRMFSYEPSGLAEADGLLARAQEASPSAIFDAWRAFLQMAMWIDGGGDEAGALREGAAEFARRAEASAEGNAAIQALVAYTRVEFLGDVEGAMRLAARAVETNPTNPLPLVSLAKTSLMAGRPEAAYELSRRAFSYSQRSRFRHFFANHHCVVSMATGRTDEAIEAAEAAAGDTPAFAAAHRHLLALYAARGEVEKAERMHARLAIIEPGFSLDRMLHDPNYPVSTLRRTGLLKAAGRLV